MAPVGVQQGLNDLASFPKSLAQVSTVPVPGSHDLAQGDHSACQFLTDRSAQETISIKDPHFSNITRIISEDNRLTDIGRQGGVQIALPQKSDPISTHGAGFGHGQQQQIQLLERVGHLRQKPTGFPTLLGRHVGFTVGSRMIDIEDKGTKPRVEIAQRQLWRSTHQLLGWRIAR
jgi:hypothetical protein